MAVSIKTKKFVDFLIGYRNSIIFKKFCKNISYIDIRFYIMDKFSAYNIVPNHKYFTGKYHIYNV